MQHTIFWRYLIPYLLLFLLMITNASSKSMLYFSDFTPYYELPILFYCMVFAPRVFPLFLLFIVGVLFDILLGHSVGISSINFVCLFMLVELQRHYLYQRGYIFTHAVFAVNLFVIALISIAMLYSKGSYELVGLATIYSKRMLATIAIYPIIHYMLARFIKPSHTSLLKSNALQR